MSSWQPPWFGWKPGATVSRLGSTIDRNAILAEIKRTAAENGGTPLGRDRFEQATGIRPRDWEGRYWARWGDAVIEAGLNPNPLNAALQREVVLEHYATLTRKLGHLPVRNELRMESLRTPGFPNDKTFWSHLGPKSDHVTKLRAYCEERGYADVLALLPPSQPAKSSTMAHRTADFALGSVYLFKSGRHYKIGRSNAAGRREYEIGLLLPDKGTLVHEIKTDDPPGIEAYWHRRFSDRRGNGEWFALTSDDVAAFRRRKFM